MDTKRQIAAILVVLALVMAVPAVAAIADNASPVEGQIPVTTDGAPTITVDASAGDEMDFDSLFESNALNITTTEGQIQVTGDDAASARIPTGTIEGSSTQVTDIDAAGAWLELDPGDKQRVDVQGDVDTLTFQQVGVDDGSTDLQIAGTTDGTVDVRVHDLAAGETYGLFDASRGEFLGVLEADTNGVASGSVELPDGSHSLQVRNAAGIGGPTISNPSPTGEVTDQPETLEVDVEGAAKPLTVEFTLDGQTAGTVETTQNQTVSVDVSDKTDSLGTFSWSATVTDGVDQTDSLSAEYTTPESITLREEHAPDTVIDDVPATIRFFTADGDVAVERTPTNGEINMTGLPDASFVVVAESDDHYQRQLFVDTIFEQENIYLLNSTEFPRSDNSAIRSRFVYEDFTGSFPREDTTIQVKRAIDLNADNESEFRTVAGDFFGAGGEFEAVLERNERYRIVVTNQRTGRSTRLGAHIPTEDLTRELRVSGLTEEAANETGVVGLAEINATSDGAAIDLTFNDPASQTDSLEVTIVDQSDNDTLYSETIAGPLGTYADTVQLDEDQQQKDWVVRFEADGGERYHQTVPVGQGSAVLPVAVPSWLLTLLLSMAVTFVGGLYGPRTALVGAWSMVFVAAGASMFGWAFSAASVAVAAMVALAFTLLSQAAR